MPGIVIGCGGGDLHPVGHRACGTDKRGRFLDVPAFRDERGAEPQLLAASGFVHQRRRAVTARAGQQVVEEVETAIASHPAVADVVVAGRPSERWGQEVVAVVALADGADADDEELAEELIMHAAKSLARYKLPKAIVFRPVIERSPSGKADYR
jgi:non-ribosomal peptide synthetase component E (peptide arylation enzyme)